MTIKLTDLAEWLDGLSVGIRELGGKYNDDDLDSIKSGLYKIIDYLDDLKLYRHATKMLIDNLPESQVIESEETGPLETQNREKAEAELKRALSAAVPDQKLAAIVAAEHPDFMDLDNNAQLELEIMSDVYGPNVKNLLISLNSLRKIEHESLNKK